MLHGEGDASAPHNEFFTAVARELRWTPAVRLLWLGQRSGGDSVLAKLDRDTLLLVCRFAVEGDVDPAERRRAATAEQFREIAARHRVPRSAPAWHGSVDALGQALALLDQLDGDAE